MIEEAQNIKRGLLHCSFIRSATYNAAEAIINLIFNPTPDPRLPIMQVNSIFHYAVITSEGMDDDGKDSGV